MFIYRKKSYFQVYRILCVIFIVLLFFSFTQHAKAESVIVEKNGLYAERISDVIFQYAREQAEHFIKEALEEEIPVNENIEIVRDSVLKLCKPYVIWNDMEYQDAVYYFPIVSENRIIAIVCVMGKSDSVEELSASFPGDRAMVDTLNKLDYLQQDYVFYECRGLVFAENEENSIQIDDISKYLADETKENSPEEEEFSALGYEEKVQAVLQKMEDFVSGSPENSPPVTQKLEKGKAKLVFIVLFLGIAGIGIAAAVYRKKHSAL